MGTTNILALLAVAVVFISGLPLSALEVRDELLRNGAADLVCMRGPDRRPVDGPEEPEGGSATYCWLTWEIQGDRHSNWPGFHSSALVTWEDEYSRSHIWWRRGDSAIPDVAYPAP